MSNLAVVTSEILMTQLDTKPYIRKLMQKKSVQLKREMLPLFWYERQDEELTKVIIGLYAVSNEFSSNPFREAYVGVSETATSIGMAVTNIAASRSDIISGKAKMFAEDGFSKLILKHFGDTDPRGGKVSIDEEKIPQAVRDIHGISPFASVEGPEYAMVHIIEQNEEDITF